MSELVWTKPREAVSVLPLVAGATYHYHARTAVCELEPAPFGPLPVVWFTQALTPFVLLAGFCVAGYFLLVTNSNPREVL